MIMYCNHCKRELPDSAFSPSRQKLKYHTCKACENSKATDYRVNKWLSDENESKFDSFCGGYVVAILNYVKPTEYKYTIKGTNGLMVQTNDVDYFKKKMDEIVFK